MVNTFFVHENVYISAKCLDYLRLNKQTSEAITIYRNIFNLKLLGNYYKVGIPYNNYDLYTWIREVVALYKKENSLFLFKENGELIKHPKGTKIIQQSYNQKIMSINNGIIELIDNNGKIMKVPENLFAGLNDHLVKLGYIYHPVILMWFNYIPALKHYINVHVAECKSRGYKNRITICSKEYEEDKQRNITVTPVELYPAWTRDNDFLIRHRSNLIRKMPKYYTSIFPNVSDDMQYFWPFTPKVGTKNGIDDKNKRYN